MPPYHQRKLSHPSHLIVAHQEIIQGRRKYFSPSSTDLSGCWEGIGEAYCLEDMILYTQCAMSETINARTFAPIAGSTMYRARKSHLSAEELKIWFLNKVGNMEGTEYSPSVERSADGNTFFYDVFAHKDTQCQMKRWSHTTKRHHPGSLLAVSLYLSDGVRPAGKTLLQFLPQSHSPPTFADGKMFSCIRGTLHVNKAYWDEYERRQEAGSELEPRTQAEPLSAPTHSSAGSGTDGRSSPCLALGHSCHPRPRSHGIRVCSLSSSHSLSQIAPNTRPSSNSCAVT
jgi:hypothetical protein